MNNNVKSFEEIGKLLFQIIDDMNKDSNKQEKKQKGDDSHYIKQLMREPPLARKTYWILKDKLILHQSIRGAASENTINAELQSLLLIDENRSEIRKLSRGDAGQQIINNLVTLKMPQLVIFPLQGFLPEFKGLTIGSTMFGIYSKILDNYQIPEYQCPKDDEPYAQEKKCIFNTISNYEKMYLNTISVGTKVYASDNKAAVQLAKKQINLSLNIIRLLIPLKYSTVSRPRISIHDIAGIDKAFVISITDGERNLSSQNLSSIFPFTYYADDDKHKTAKAIERAHQIAGKYPNNLSNLENRIVGAITWAGEGIDAVEKDIKVVKCVVALETLFGIKKGNKQKGFVDGIIRLFGDYVHDKDCFRDLTKDIYELRSTIVHEGKRDISDEDAEWAERFASGCLLKVLEIMDKFRTEKEYQNWLGINIEPPSIEKILLTTIKKALENINKKSIKLSNFGLDTDDADIAKYQERPFAYEFFHQLMLLKERKEVGFGKYYVHPEVDKEYQHYFKSKKIPDFIIHTPNSDNNLAVIELKLTNNPNIEADLKKLVEFKNKTKPRLQYTYGIEVIIGSTKAITKAKKKIQSLSKTEGTEIIIIWFNIDSWQASESTIKY